VYCYRKAWKIEQSSFSCFLEILDSNIGMKAFILIVIAITLFSCSEKQRFELLDPGRTGLTFVNKVIDTDSLHVMNFEYIYNGAGVGIADLNNDGRMDLVFNGNQESPRAYLNEGNLKFKDITSSFEDLDQGHCYSGVSEADINCDGYPDAILTGNDHSYDISTGYYDANKGLLLLSKNGQPLSELLTWSQSGFILQGMVGSLLYMEGDSPLVVAGLNRKKARVFSLAASPEN